MIGVDAVGGDPELFERVPSGQRGPAYRWSSGHSRSGSSSWPKCNVNPPLNETSSYHLCETPISLVIHGWSGEVEASAERSPCGHRPACGGPGWRWSAWCRRGGPSSRPWKGNGAQAMTRFAVLQPHLEDDVPLPRAAAKPASRSGPRNAGWRATAKAAWPAWRARPPRRRHAPVARGSRRDWSRDGAETAASSVAASTAGSAQVAKAQAGAYRPMAPSTRSSPPSTQA